jgi:hypothetical protein
VQRLKLLNAREGATLSKIGRYALIAVATKAKIFEMCWSCTSLVMASVMSGICCLKIRVLAAGNPADRYQRDTA